MAGWQVLALILCGAGTVVSYTCTIYGEFISILALAICYFIIFITNVWWWPKSKTPWWSYFLVALFCLGGDISGVFAYNYTSLASAMLLATTVIFWVAPIAYFVFHRKVNWKQMIAMILGVLGVSMILIAQGIKDSKLKGNLIALSSAICYAFSTILQEKLVKDDSARLYLLRLSISALPISIILSGSLEWKTIKNYKWETKSICLTVGYSVLLSLYYMLSPVIMKYSNATVMNISMLSSNFYSLAIDIFLFGSKANWLYLVGFMFIPLAVSIFVLSEPKPSKDSAPQLLVSDDISSISKEPSLM